VNGRAIISRRGAARWRRGHPWVYRSDVMEGPTHPGIVAVTDPRGRFRGQALWSPASEIQVRFLTNEETPITRDWWAARLRDARARREFLEPPATAYRVAHAEGDGLPSLVVDRYGEVVVAQLLSAGLEAVRTDVLDAIESALSPGGVLLRNDASVRRHEGLALSVEVARGTVPDVIEVREAELRYLVAPRKGQKTGAYLDQREHHVRLGRLATGRALDLFCYSGLFALHMAGRADEVLGVDMSAAAIEAARANQELNGIANVRWEEANGFDLLRTMDRASERFDTIVLDPPPFAKDRSAVLGALRGYKELNLRALRLLTPGGLLFTTSCSYHVGRRAFLAMLSEAAADAGRRVALVGLAGQPADHPEILGIPETGYLKGALLRVLP
jgi:23S rRNA (cytosine1962-C5)-methyltransferase